MNARERMLTVLDGGIPDRIPSFEILIDPGFREAVHPGLDYYDFQAAMGFDLVIFGLGASDEPVTWEDREKKIFRDKWGVRMQFTTEVMPHILTQGPVIDSETDLRNHVFPDPAHPAILAQTREVARRFKGERAIGYLGEETFAVQQYLRGGLEQLMIDYAEENDLVEGIARRAADYYCELYRNVIREGVEVIILGDDYAGNRGPYMSPAHFRRYIEPGLRRVVKECRTAGARVVKHTDGDLWPILDMIAATGVNALGPLEPVPSMVLSKIKAAYPGVAVMGNVDVALLSVGTREAVYEAARRAIEDAKPGGRYIFSSGNSITSSVKPELYRAMMEAREAFGAY